MPELHKVVKRDGRNVPFDNSKIADAIFQAATAVGGEDRQTAEDLAEIVTVFLENNYSDHSPPGIEDIQDLVEKTLIETGHAKTAKTYILYREKRARLRGPSEPEHDGHLAAGRSRLARRTAQLGQEQDRRCAGEGGRASRARCV